jgi:ornithine cyclodeaminase/alanine dehydrogenase-like protein (mu-crystallin family)
MSSASASSSADGGPPYVGAARVAAAVPMSDAVRAVEGALRTREHRDPPRAVVDVTAGQLLLMPSESGHAVGVKLAAVAPDNPGRGLERIQALYVLLDGQTLVPTLIIDGAALTTLRTPAVSAVTAARLAVPDATELVVFGSGPQAWGHVLAMRAVRPLRCVRVVGRDPARAAALVDRVRELGLTSEVAGPEAVAGADIVCLCTTARTPVLDGGLLAEHAHVVAVGSHEPDAREVDAATVARSYLVVEDRATALREAGDVVLALAEGAIGHDHLRADLRELVADTDDHTEELTLFKSVGMAWEDLAVAELVKQRCG